MFKVAQIQGKKVEKKIREKVDGDNFEDVSLKLGVIRKKMGNKKGKTGKNKSTENKGERKKTNSERTWKIGRNGRTWKIFGVQKKRGIKENLGNKNRKNRKDMFQKYSYSKKYYTPTVPQVFFWHVD